MGILSTYPTVSDGAKIQGPNDTQTPLTESSFTGAKNWRLEEPEHTQEDIRYVQMHGSLWRETTSYHHAQFTILFLTCAAASAAIEELKETFTHTIQRYTTASTNTGELAVENAEVCEVDIHPQKLACGAYNLLCTVERQRVKYTLVA